MKNSKKIRKDSQKLYFFINKHNYEEINLSPETHDWKKNSEK